MKSSIKRKQSDKTRKTSLMEIIITIDGDDLFKKCLISDKPCIDSKDNKCSLHEHYETIRKDISSMFSEYTIGKLADEYKSSDIRITL